MYKRQDHDAFIRAYPLDISPATDNRPFFFNLVLLGDLFDPALSGSGVYRTSMEAIVILFAVIGVTAAVSALFIIVPLWLGGRRRGLARPAPSTLAYFGGLGLAFMLVEIPTMQKLTVYLGQPVYSLAVVLFSLLLFSGLGLSLIHIFSRVHIRRLGRLGRFPESNESLSESAQSAQSADHYS